MVPGTQPKVQPKVTIAQLLEEQGLVGVITFGIRLDDDLRTRQLLYSVDTIAAHLLPRVPASAVQP